MFKRTNQFISSLTYGGIAIVLCLIALTAAFWGSSTLADVSQEPTVVYLNASWCATCRELGPVINRVANQSSVKMVSLDVDTPQAPTTASQYGISISGSNIPQVYLFNKGRTVMIFDGSKYKFGQSKQAEAQMTQQLNANL